MVNLENSCFYRRLIKFSNIIENSDLLDNFNKKDASVREIEAVFNKLGILLLNPKYTNDIALHFRRELLLVLFSTVNFKDPIQLNHHRICIALAKLINVHPDVKNFTIHYFKKYSDPFNGDSYVPPTKKAKVILDDVADLEIVVASYTFLRACPDFCKSAWTWSSFMSKYFNHEDNLIRWYCCQCLQIILGMNEGLMNDLIKHKHLTDNIQVEVGKQVEDPSTYQFEYTESDYSLLRNKNVVCISGICLPIYSDDTLKETIQLVEVESTKRNLRRIALGIVSSTAMIIRGTVGSGKTFIVEYLASKTGRVLGKNFIKVQLSDEADSKMLLGTYCCTDVPGEFIWQPGVLTQAIIDGSWLLLEDVDLANMDIASLITALLENENLTVPGFRDGIPISEDFKLFMTQRLISTVTGYQKKSTNAIALLEKNLMQINLEPLTSLELETIVQITNPKLKTIASRMIQTFLLFSVHSNNRSQRLVSTRDLFKWCVRSTINFDVTSQICALNVLQNAIDVFCSAYAVGEDRSKLARDISSCLGITNEKADFYCELYKPTLNITNNTINSDRVLLNKRANYSDVRHNFCFTRPSARLLEQIMCCIKMKEPVLLVGETGTGKTSAIQYLAYVLGVKLVVINMNQQSDSADLLGGYKPVNLKFVVAPVRKEFEKIFKDYFNVNENKEFLKNIDVCYNEQKWSLLLKLMTTSCQAALQRLKTTKGSFNMIHQSKRDEVFFRWLEVHKKLEKLSTLLKQKPSLAFSFVEGSLVKAVKDGSWVLLDEINLANPETLECLSGLLENEKSSINLIERGDKEPIERHSNFILFACMNPSTDIAKRDLPTGLRNRFTEFFVDELTDKNDLLLLVDSYLHSLSIPAQKLENIVKFYLCIRKEAQLSLSDGLGHKPHYSLRTLCRALTIAARNPCKHFVRSLYEAFCLSFLTQLDIKSYKTVETLIVKYILGNAKDMKSTLNQPIPKFEEDCIELEGYWVIRGNLEPEIPSSYVLTDMVRHNLKDLVRIVSIGNSPVLLQGDTSVGKTSLITYLAKCSGNTCVRINNHEHTDLQEYIGSYIVDVDGKLVFREGVLVEAMRKGHWLILDELNLAPTDVLEALNRVLDDNRELFIPETHQVVKAHRDFVLFATQNPPGLYGGRKVLSRAFRNRFVELHFSEIPSAELEVILHKRCKIPMSYSTKMVAVMNDLQIRRCGSAAFAGKKGFITLRDLFRWGERYRLADVRQNLYDWDQHIADEGYLLLAGRVRKTEEKDEIAQVLEKYTKRRVIPENLFSLTDKTSAVTKHILQKLYELKKSNKNIVWTFNMRRLAVLLAKCLEFKEPSLLVGETGGGKTTICQLLANINSQQLYTINCHMHTESSDFIGGLRPIRDRSEGDLNRLFEWVDGPLLKAAIEGGMFLADEISLADDSVLERLNSLLEPERCLLLAEKGSDSNNSVMIVAHESFHFVATMNPGGDYGKKELSPALRNRFTEIWCETCTDRKDLVEIIEENIDSDLILGNGSNDGSGFGKSIMDFVEWFKETEIGRRCTVSLRDLLTWTKFINICARDLGVANAFIHGACLTFLDSFGSGNTSAEKSADLEIFQEQCIKFLMQQLERIGLESPKFSLNNLTVEEIDSHFGIKPFYIKVFENTKFRDKGNFFFHAPTCTFNTLRLLRGLQLNKAILLEGSPGVGKTSLVMALAKSVGIKVVRINLSDQTDISDLFGADFPVENGMGGSFEWRDGPFLRALKCGLWILLDELNLASQSVLEGLNACLDHRGEIFIPELAKTFYVKPGTRLFACQNPVLQGGSRRGLPQSFLNRFTQVFVKPLNEADLEQIVTYQFPMLSSEIVSKMIQFNSHVVDQLDQHIFGHRGSPWEFNLRDVIRWCEAVVKNKSSPEAFVQLIYSDRMRTDIDKRRMLTIFEEIFGRSVSGTAPAVYVTESKLYVGDLCMEREIRGVNRHVLKQVRSSLVLRNQIPVLRSLGHCVKMNWLVILVGASGSGKSSVVQTMASLLGKTVRTLPVTSAMDTTDLLGGFEQFDYTRHLEEISRKAESILLETVQNQLSNGGYNKGLAILKVWEKCSERLRTASNSQTMLEETKLFKSKLLELLNLLDHLISIGTFPTEYVCDLQNKIQTLLLQVSVEDNLHAKGRFEWIDSLLIKCLEEGSWLLVDNVNLCSPAVLDRLNGLLEPQGVLKIGERGIRPDGKMFKVRPHKDFRLFLTMDPKNGEISRAMRNRGIEVYLLSEHEEGFVKNDLDLKSMINLGGLTNVSHIDVLLKMHNFISDSIIGEKPNINYLLRAAKLTAQQLLRGINISSALYHSAIDVYYQQTCFQFVSTNLLSTIEEKISTFFGDKADYYHTFATLHSCDLHINSCLAIIKQQTVLLRYLDDNMFLNSLINVFTMSSSKNLRMRHAYVRKLLVEDKSQFLEMNDISLQICENFENGELPLDCRWIPDLGSSNASANNLYLTLYFVLKKMYLQSKTTAGKSITLYDFLKAVFNNKIESKIDDILEKNFLNVLNVFDQFLLEIIKNNQLDDLEAIQVISLLQWRFILQKFTDVTIIRDEDLEEYKKIVDKLHIHYRWFVKHSVEKLCLLLNVEVSQTLSTMMNTIRSHAVHYFSTTQKLSKMIQKSGLKPLPFNNHKQIVAYDEYKTLIDDFDLNAQNDYKKMISFLYTRRDLRRYIIEARSKLNDFWEENGQLKKLKDLHCEFLDTDFGKVNQCYLEILPVMDHLACLVLNNLKCDFNNIKNKHVLEETLTVPSSLLGILEYFFANKLDYLQYELKTTIKWYLLNSASVNSFKLTQNVGSARNPGFMTPFAPKLSILITNLLMTNINSNENLRSTTFGNYRELTTQHRKLNLVLWRNMLQMSCPDYDYLKCETKYVINGFKEFLSVLSDTFTVTAASTNDLFELCLKKVEEFYRVRNNAQEGNLFINLFKRCGKEVKMLSNKEENSTYLTLNSISNALFLLSFLKTLLTAKLPLIDPFIKTELKKEYCREEIEEFSHIVNCYKLQNEIHSNTLETVHNYVPLMEKHLAGLDIKMKRLREYVAVRPQDPNYAVMSKEILHYTEMVLKPARVNKIFDDLDETCMTLCTTTINKTPLSKCSFEKILQEARQHSFNLEGLIKILNKYRYNYSDIIGPLLCDVTEFYYAITLKIHLSETLRLEYDNMIIGIDLNKDLTNIVRFPVLNENQNDYLEAIALYTRPHLQCFVKKINVDENLEIENFRLLRTGIQEIYNVTTVKMQYYKIFDKKLFDTFNGLLKIFADSWKKQEEEIERNIKERESIYKFNSCRATTEDDKIEEEFDRLFPSYRDKDFPDFEPKTLDDDFKVPFDRSALYVGFISLDDVKFVSETHSRFLRLHTESEWLFSKSGTTENFDFVTPLISKLKLYRILVEKFGKCLNYVVDTEIIGSLSILTSVAENFGDAKLNQLESSYDFYKSLNIEEVKSSYHILEELRVQVSELLNEWPDHPSLNLINDVINRIFSFDIASPLSRFLTGFEILLTKCHEWEENAHAGVSLQQNIQNLVRQIISWRKIEMTVWKDSLNIAFNRANEPVAKWWFHMYEIVSQFTEGDKIDVIALVETLRNFIERSNLGEFSNRLQLLLTFHYHVVHLKRTKNTVILVAVLWNLHQFYKQFETNVEDKIKKLRAPIEKKLKDYVKIVRWKDISYWAIKQTVERTHKTLHKHIREFEMVLKQLVTPCLTLKVMESDSIGAWNKSDENKPFVQDVLTYIAQKIKNSTDITPDANESFRRAEKYFNKSRHLCKKVLTKTTYTRSIETLDELINDVIDTSTRLQNLEVNTTLSKDKQKSQAKSILQQKRKALADLFKGLAEIGLSYRTGLVQCRLNNEHDHLLTKPIDLCAVLYHIDKTYQDVNDAKLLKIWEDCENYYNKAQAQLQDFKNNARTPSEDLGFQNLERCKGFSENLMQMVYKHKSLLINTSRTFYYLRMYSQSFTTLDRDPSSTKVSFETHQNIVSLLQNILITLEQYKIILDTAPRENAVEIDSNSVPILEPLPNNFIMYKNDKVWRFCLNKIEETLVIARKLLRILADVICFVPSIEFNCSKYVLVSLPLKHIIDDLEHASENIRNLDETFEKIPLTKSARWLIMELGLVKEHLMEQHTEHKTETINATFFKRNAQKLMKKILVVVQCTYKKYKEQDSESSELLKTSILQSLSSDADILNMLGVLKDLHNTIKYGFKLNSLEISKCKFVILQIRPILNQLIMFYQYFLTQQVSAYRAVCKMCCVVCNIFNSLVTKGFCIPPEFSEELNSDGNDRGTNGMGLGEGEGERDVSDRIESEDQLDDAEPTGQEEKEQEDADCKEEEKGIDMSDDFDAKIQDIENENDDNDTEDAEEQMGDTDKNAEQLDQQIWGSDDEEDDNKDDEGEHETGDRGEKQGQDELAAKENEETNKHEDKEGKNSDEKRKEINELEDPVYDDDQVDPYHGNPPQYPEPETMDLPEDIQVDDDMQENNENPNEENPFDIDAMKEQQPSLELEPEIEPQEEVNEEERECSDSEESNINDMNRADNDQSENGQNEDEYLRKQEDERCNDEPKDPKDNQQSALDETQAQDETQAMDVDNIEANDNVKMNKSQNQNNSQTNEEVCQEDTPDNEGVGQSRMEDSTTGHASRASAQQDISTKRSNDDKLQVNQKPGETDSKRSLGNVNDPIKKKLKTMEAQQEEGIDYNREDKSPSNAEIYQHIKNSERSDNQVLDAATEEQAKEQKELSEIENRDESEEFLKEQGEEDSVYEMVKHKVEQNKSETKKVNKKQHREGEILEDVSNMEIEGEVVDTLTVSRGDDTTYHTRYDTVDDIGNHCLTIPEINRIRGEVERQLSNFLEPPTNTEAEHIWKKISSLTSTLAQALSEQLRLVLEPTHASRLKGDYRSGRRINMRKVIPYIASQFRKDKIWLRRTKPYKREYQIALAIDDSSSMSDNHSKELAFESVALISKALTLLESGQLSVLSFGETVEILHKLSDSFTEKSGANVIQKFQFAQRKTCVAKLVDFATQMLNSVRSSATIFTAKLLIIVSDGRGIFSEGESFVQQAVRQSQLLNIFIVFIIVDNPQSKDSILDIRTPVFKDGKLLGIKPYMDSFPFPFYIILRNINTLPNVLSDALRQWFEIVSNFDKQ
ncbi:hypothetical protein FQR65_LT08397 [Abscondita terminalis]|nr:hypothetical protein FQR65_LT08397 [Abscondita terminalis]